MDTVESEPAPISHSNDEVERLQELVNQLEVQNQLLRSKHCSDSDLKSKTKIDNVANDSYTNKGNISQASNCSNNAQKLNNSIDNAVDDFDILDITSVPSLEDEESWLFTSPKKVLKQQQQHNISPYKWMRQEFESPEVEPAKRSLLYQLDEVQRSSPVPAASPPFDTRTFTKARSAVDTSTFTRPRKAIDTGTFTRKSGLAARQSPSYSLSAQEDSGRSLSPSHSPRNQSPRNMSPRAASPSYNSPRNISPRNSPEYDRNGNASSAGLASSTSTSSSSVGGAASASRIGDTVDGVPPPARNPHADVLDIQVMARMQEESLRQSINSSPKKTFKGIRNLKQAQQQKQHQHQLQQQLQQQQQGEHDSSESSNRSSPARFDGDMYQVHRSSNNSLAGSSLSSHSNSPPDSPYNSTQQLNRSEMSYRRSLPNLSGRLLAPPSSASTSALSSSLLHSHPSDSSLPTTGRNTNAEPPPPLYSQPPRRLVKPPSVASQQRPSGLAKPGSGVPRAIPSPSAGRGGIPRPRPTSRLPAPRSRIPGSGGRSSAQAGNHLDDSWKDGCF